jgi:hypothetical protein
MQTSRGAAPWSSFQAKVQSATTMGDNGKWFPDETGRCSIKSSELIVIIKDDIVK